MRKSFHQYWNKPGAELKTSLSTALVAFDTNVLLNFYRYSEATRTELLHAMKKCEQRVWLPNWVGVEFHKNRCAVIGEQVKHYSDILVALEKLQESLKHRRQHPHIDGKLSSDFDMIADRIKHGITDGREQQELLIADDPIREDIARLFESRVGEAFSEEEIEAITKEGEKRYERLIPPGFKDKDKGSTDGVDQYGDLIIWKQLIKHAKCCDHPSVFFVTDDRKEDWWFIVRGRSLGARPELRVEFMDETGKEIAIISPESFIKFNQGEESGDTDSLDKVVSEIREVAEQPKKLAKKNQIEATLEALGRMHSDMIAKIRARAIANAEAKASLEAKAKLEAADELLKSILIGESERAPEADPESDGGT